MKIDGLIQNNLDNVLNTKRVSDETGFESALKKAYDTKDKEKLKKVCTQLESIMLQTLYKQMKATVPKAGITEESHARSIFQDMMDEEMMNACGSRGVGIADMMYRQLSAQMDRTYTASDHENQNGEEETPSPNGAETVDKPMD